MYLCLERRQQGYWGVNEAIGVSLIVLDQLDVSPRYIKTLVIPSSRANSLNTFRQRVR